MDPQLVNESSFLAANPSPYSLAEIWPYPINGSGAAEVGPRMGNMGHGFGESSAQRDCSAEESTVREQSGGGCGRKIRDLSSEDESSKIVSTYSSANDLTDSNDRRMKVSGSKNENDSSKTEVEESSAADTKPAENSRPSEPSKDYIHVRARRGQATGSHSRAERVRREKISERMKILQDLVPGCNKVIGKALLLDEIINYIQSLQRQVETDSNGRRMNVSGSKNENDSSKTEVEASSAADTKPAENCRPSEPSKDYIHVRARRGQATDSHSLAERVRREKISERMKILQDLVPGCNKVIGKALLLDEIINYIQSLQRQVEFLSMKLEAIRSRM